MGSQQPTTFPSCLPAAAAAAPPPPPPFSAVPMASQTLAMDVDDEDERKNRAASVLSGMSQEDMEAAETLKSLQAHYHSPSRQPPPRLIQSQTAYSPNEQHEPLFSLLTSQYPLTASMINRSLSVYRGTQSLIPGAYTVEQNVGLPLACMLSRVTGVEGGIRWALQPRRRNSQDQSTSKPQKADVEAGIEDPLLYGRPMRRSSGMSEQLPPYDDLGRSPPYQEHQLVPQTGDGHTPPGWRAQLMISTSGLGIAMSEESLRSLRYCLSWLRWANDRLGGVILSVNDVLKRWDESRRRDGMSHPAAAGNEQSSQAALAGRIQELKGVVLHTLKQVVDVVSNYAGGALPENARNLVHRHLTSLPLRFRLASSMSSDDNGKDNNNNSSGSGNGTGEEGARRVLMLAQEGLNMMGQVSGVVSDTLVSAESWCEKLGRRHGQQHPPNHPDLPALQPNNSNSPNLKSTKPVSPPPLPPSTTTTSAASAPAPPSSADVAVDVDMDTDIKMEEG